MEQRDILKDQIEQMGKVLGKLLSKFLDLKATGNVVQGIEVSNKALESEANIKIDEIIEFEKSELFDFLKNGNFNETSLEYLIEYMNEMAQHLSQSNPTKSKKILNQILNIYEYLNDNTSMFSLDRYQQIEKIKIQIQELEK